VLFCRDVTQPPEPEEGRFLEDQDPGRLLVVHTKSDLLGGRAIEGKPPAGVLLSVRSGEGMSDLLQMLVSTTFGMELPGDRRTPLLTNERQRRAMRHALSEVEGFDAALRGGVPHEFASTHLRSSVAALEELVGIIT